MREALRAAWPYLRHAWQPLGIGIVTVVVLEAASAVVPLLLRRGVDALARGEPSAVVVQAGGAMLVAVAGKALLLFLARFTFMGASRDVEHALRRDLFAHLVSLSPDFYRRHRVGELMAHATNDLAAVRMMVGPGLFNWCDAICAFAFAIGVLAWVDWRLTLVALAPAPLATFVVVRVGRVIHDRFERIQETFAEISSRVQEHVAGVRVIRAFGLEAQEAAAFATLDDEFVRRNLALARASSLLTPTLQLLTGISALLVLWVGAHRMWQGAITLGDYVMFNTYVVILMKPMVTLGRVVAILQRGAASTARIRALMATSAQIAPPALPQALDECEGRLDFEHVSVEIDGRPALHGVRFSVPPRTTVAVVGATGSGKSTLVQLVPRLSDPVAGRVLLDGVDLRALDPVALRRHIGMVPQETFLFSATLRENLTFGAPDADERQVRRAIEVAGLAPDLAELPAGLDTMVGERGVSLSGGQKQRVAIARAVLCEPAVLVLDDALSSVDAATEGRILAHLRDVMRGRTTLLVSHRVSTARHADLVVVLAAGRLVEMGTHETLAAEDGYYAALCREQAAAGGWS